MHFDSTVKDTFPMKWFCVKPWNCVTFDRNYLCKSHLADYNYRDIWMFSERFDRVSKMSCGGANNGPKLNAGLGSFMIFQRICTSIAKKPYILIFQGGGGFRFPCPTPLWFYPWLWSEYFENTWYRKIEFIDRTWKGSIPFQSSPFYILRNIHRA